MALLKRKRSGLSDPMSVVTRFVNACNRHDADSVAACLHPEFDSIQPMFPSRNFRGADQVRRNWQAIFDAEPGFRLTVLRQAAADDTVWLELHGAGRDAEVAGIFVMGTQGDRIRWARIYSALIEPLPEGFTDPAASSPATLRRVPPLREPGDEASEPVAAGGDGPVEEDLIAPVVDIEGGSRSRRRRSSRRRSHDAETPAAEVPDTESSAAGAEVTEGEPAVAEPHATDESQAVDGKAVDDEATGEPVIDEPAAVDWAPAPDGGSGAGPVALPVDDAEALVEAAPVPDRAEAADVLEEREPDVVAEARPQPVAPGAEMPAVEPVTAGDMAAAEPETGVAAPGAAGAADLGPDDIAWADLAADEPDAGEPSEPTTSIERPGGLGRPGKRRGRKKR